MIYAHSILQRSCAWALGACLASATLPALAAGDPDAAKGILVEHCSGCHVVPAYTAQGLPTVEATSFQEIADRPETYTERRLRAFLRQPHWPMGQFRLSPSDIDNILAYLGAIRAP